MDKKTSKAEEKLNKIKGFFTKKKAEAKFKLGVAGPGRKLNDDSPTVSQPAKKTAKDAYVPPKRDHLTDEAKRAAAAAMSRFQGKTEDFDFSLQAIRAQARKELEAERAAAKESTSVEVAKEVDPDQASQFAVQGVFFRCPFISEEILPKKEWKVKIKEFLYEQLEQERGLTSCLIIHNCNTKEKIEPCVETLIRYIENIINHPDEEKYRKIRMSNRIYQEKVESVEGAFDFLTSIGFEEQTIDDEKFLIFAKDVAENLENMNTLLEALKCSEPIPIELDRNLQVLLPSQVRVTALPPEFFRVTVEELKREQQARAEALERSQILMTKTMREKEEQRVINRYNFALIRVRFPDGVYLQGTFHVFEKLEDVFEMVKSALKTSEAEFSLVSPTGHKFNGSEDREKSLHDLKLIPNTVLNFAYEGESKSLKEYLKEEMLVLIQQV
ncbi:UBX domain-containing protein 6 [Culicoides brevitarsis]|uniref:UBX domain-containing protein 6 n=1 Tax=Culicoides brevitarsis TaxID=469753 RepID=UPI00307C62D8